MSMIHKFQSFENKNNPYAFGWNSAADHADKVARTQAFGAIRRAAAVARRKDHLARLFTDTLPNHPGTAKYEAAGDAIRQAIRAAIASDKP